MMPEGEVITFSVDDQALSPQACGPESFVNLMDHVQSIAASTAAMTVAAMRQGDLDILDSAGHVASTSPPTRVEEAVISRDSRILPSVAAESSHTFQLLESRLEELETTTKLQESTLLAEVKKVAGTSQLLESRLGKLLGCEMRTRLQESTLLAEAAKATRVQVSGLLMAAQATTTTIERLEGRVEKQERATELRESALLADLEETKAALAEIRDFETVKVTWTINHFYAKVDGTRSFDVYSSSFHAAGYQLCLRLTVGKYGQPTVHDEELVSLFIQHKGGYQLYPISIQGSTFTLSGITQSLLSENDLIKSATLYGWPKFTTMGALRRSSLRSTNDVTVEGFVRVRRLLNRLVI